MEGWKRFEQEIREIQQLLAEENLSRQASQKRFTIIEQKLSMLKIDDDFNDNNTTKVSQPKIIAIANGCKVPDKDFPNIKDNNFDVVLNIPTHTLKARKNPAKRTKLEICSCRNIGNYRLTLLIYFLEHPGVYVCAESIHKVYGPSARIAPNTLASAVKIFRKAVKQSGTHGPYVLTEFVWGPSVSRSGYFYTFNPKWSYLVIRYER